VDRCPENALVHIPGKGIVLIETLCSGCGVCKLVCPNDAIESSESINGWIELLNARSSLDVIYGELMCGSRRSNNLIIETLYEALRISNRYDYLVVDLPPGTGAGIASVIKRTDVVIIATEPTPLGLSDTCKFLKLVSKLGAREVIAVINKWGIGGIEDKIVEFFSEKGIRFFKVPYSYEAIESYMYSKPISEIAPQSNVASSILEIVKYLVRGT